jgi:type II secretory pathway pseudopilin PulG
MTHAWTTWLAADPCPAAANPDWLTWLTPPVATVLAATIAVVGALIAYAGVTKTTRTTRRENRREEKIAVLADATVAVQELIRAVDRVALTTDPTARAEQVAKMNAGPMKKLGDKYSLAETKLELYGFEAATKEVNTLSDTLIVVWDGLRANPADAVNLDQSHSDYDNALEALKKALKKLR